MERKRSIVTLKAKGRRTVRVTARVSANTPEGKKILEESIRREMNNMTRESAIKMLARTGMYDNQGRLKEEYR